MTLHENYSSEMYPKQNLLNWLNYMLEYNRISFNAKNFIHKICWFGNEIGHQDIILGACRYVIDVIRNSDINSKPRILSEQNSTSAPSIFLTSKPGAIMNIGMSNCHDVESVRLFIYVLKFYI